MADLNLGPGCPAPGSDGTGFEVGQSDAPVTTQFSQPRFPEAKTKFQFKERLRQSEGGKRRFVTAICNDKTSYHVEQWVGKIYQMDPKGALKQMKELNALDDLGPTNESRAQQHGTRCTVTFKNGTRFVM